MTADEAQAQGLSEALGIIFRPPLTANRDERHHDDTLYWLEKVRDAVSDVGKGYFDINAPDGDYISEALLDAENAVEDRIYEYRQAWEAAKAREASDYMDDDRR